MTDREFLRREVTDTLKTFADGYIDLHELRDYIMSVANTKSCPCEYGSPCKDSCSCASPHLSGGCSRCCKYGSEEQRKEMAEYIIRRDYDEMEMLWQEKAKHDEECHFRADTAEKRTKELEIENNELHSQLIILTDKLVSLLKDNSCQR